jgi:DNA (cytosine-5)-methyltransferase 1
MKLRVFESFSGVGSMSMALKNLGVDFELVGTSEVDRYAILAYDAIHGNNEDIVIPSKEEMLQEFVDKNIAYNFSTGKSEIPRGIKDITKLYKAHIRSKNFGDIRKISPEDLPEMDLYTYSFPCKNISVAGRGEGLKEGSDTQSSLVWECFKIIEYCKPKYLLMENVKNLISKKHKPQFDLICKKLENLGYNNYWELLNGKDFGVPQNRERVIMISIRKDVDNGKFKMPTIKIKCPNINSVLEKEIPSKYKMTEKCINKMIKYKPKNMKNKDIFPTLTTELAHNAGKNITPKICMVLNEYRRLMPIECWRLMGFSDEDFYKAKNIGGLSDTKLYERSARGIVVPMLEEIFRNMMKNEEE